MKLLLILVCAVLGDQSYKMVCRGGPRIAFIPVPEQRFVLNQVKVGQVDRLDAYTYSLRLERVHIGSSLTLGDMSGWRGIPQLSKDIDTGVITVSSSDSGYEFKVSLVNVNGEFHILFEALVPRYIVPEGQSFAGSRLRFVRARGETTEGEFWIDSFEQKIEMVGDGQFEFIFRNVTRRTGDVPLFASVGEWRGTPSIHTQTFTKALVIEGADEEVYFSVKTEERGDDVAIVFSPKKSDTNTQV